MGSAFFRPTLIVVCGLCAVFALPMSGSCAQSISAAEKFYRYERMRMNNGFEVILRQRSETRNVAFRLVVYVGTRHFDCSRSETPHVIEHLLFSGTSRHSEAELERYIEDLGGNWNAVTGAEQTIYQLDIYDQYALEGLDTLFEIITDTVFTPEKVKRVMNIVYREEGGRPNAFRRILYRAGIGKSAWKKADEWLLPGEGGVCRGLIDMEKITEESVREKYRSAYVPENMTLIAVGNINRRKLLKRIAATFGSMGRVPKPTLHVVTPTEPSAGPVTVSSTLSPFLGSSGSISVAFRTEGRENNDAAALMVLSALLNTRFYEQVRIQEGLSYAPETVMFFQPDYGVFYATADVSVENISKVRNLIIDMLDSLRKEKIASQEVARTKRKMLLQWAQGYETNGGIASLLADRISREKYLKGLRAGNGPERLSDYESEVASVSPEDLDRVIARYIRPENRIDIRSVPTMSYAEFFVVTGGAVLLIVIGVGYRIRKTGRNRKRLPQL